MWRLVIGFTVAAHVLTAQTPVTLTITNGRWFDGTTFVARTAVVAGNVLSFRPVEPPPAPDTTTIDLKGGHVIPPFEAESAADVDAKWTRVVSSRPSIVKAFLQYSEEYEARRGDPKFFGNRGLSPEAFRRVVALAHRDQLRVAAHVASAQDFSVAVRAGADVIAHLPGYLSPETIAPADAKLAAAKKIVLIPTASLARGLARGAGVLERVQTAQRENLRLLKQEGVALAIGSDSWSDTSHQEVEYLRTLNVFDDLDLLRMWTENCAATVFPGRKIGRLVDGAEADFLVLDSNPLVDFAATRRILQRVKNGQVLPPPETK